MRQLRPREGKQPASGHTVHQSRARARVHIPASSLQKQAATGIQRLESGTTIILSESTLPLEEATPEDKKI